MTALRALHLSLTSSGEGASFGAESELNRLCNRGVPHVARGRKTGQLRDLRKRRKTRLRDEQQPPTGLGMR